MLLIEYRRITPDFKIILKAMASLFREPKNLDHVYNLEDGLLHTKASTLAIEWIKTDPDVCQIIEERYLAPEPDIEKLLQYPQDSLGYAYASYIKESGFDPGFYRSIKVEDDVSYFTLRTRQTHDIWHIVTGFGTDGLGEIGLKAFELAQTRRNLAVFIVSIAMLSTLIKSPETLPNLLEKISMGYKMGLTAKPLFAQKWEENWDKPLSQWRDELGIEKS